MTYYSNNYYQCDRCGVKENKMGELVLSEKSCHWFTHEGKSWSWNYCNNCLKEVMKILRIKK